MRLLEAPNRPFRQRTVEAIDWAGSVGPVAQRALEPAYAHCISVGGVARAISEHVRGRFTPIRSTSRKARPRQAQQKRRGQCARRRHSWRSKETWQRGRDGRRIDPQHAESTVATCNSTRSSV
jgi:hypothetical protein